MALAGMFSMNAPCLCLSSSPFLRLLTLFLLRGSSFLVLYLRESRENYLQAAGLILITVNYHFTLQTEDNLLKL